QLSDESKADHRNHIAELNARRADRVHRDAAERGKARLLASDTFGNSRRQIASDEDRLRVTRPFAAVRHALADFEIGDGLMPRRHHASARISEYRILTELRAHLGERRHGSSLHGDVPDLA